MKLMWTGTDTLFYSSWPPHKWYYLLAVKIFARIADFFVQEHYIVSEHLRPELKGLRKPIKVLVDPPLFNKPIEKIRHDKFTILYLYKKGKFWEWIYGTDIVEKMKAQFPQCDFIGVSGHDDMSDIYPFVDLYIRPNRHDGEPRMVMECKANDIPVIATKSDPHWSEFYIKIKKYYEQYLQDNRAI